MSRKHTPAPSVPVITVPKMQPSESPRQPAPSPVVITPVDIQQYEPPHKPAPSKPIFYYVPKD